MQKSNSETYIISKKGEAPAATVDMAKSVSQYRRGVLESEINEGKFSTGEQNNYIKQGQGITSLGNVITSSLKKEANFSYGSTGGDTGTGYRGSSETVRQTPEVYSPLWLNSNLNLPRDRATINAWSRSFYALNPMVQNAINLHSTYPISKLNIKCDSPKVSNLIGDMIDEIGLINICVQIAQEYWTLGEVFPYAELNEGTAKWNRITIQNPDYIDVKRSVSAGESLISLRPDENLKRIITGNSPSDVQQRQQLNRGLIEHVKRGENIPLSNFNVSHIARKNSPYESRGTGLPVSCFRQLMLFDKLRECHSIDTEVLTRKGFQKISEITEISQNIDSNANYINGIQLDKDNNISGIYKLKDDVEVACFNSETEEIEYHKPIEFHMSHYNGEMMHFTGKKVDCLVSPNHKMWTKTKNSNWSKIPASKMLEKKNYWKFRSHAKWNGKKINTINVCGNDIDANMYLEFLGYMASEGCVYKNFDNNRYDALIILSQLTKNDKHIPLMQSMINFATDINSNITQKINVIGSGYSEKVPKEKWEGRIHNKNIVEHFLNEIGNGESAKSHNKRLPRWVMELCSEQLEILLNALMYGDGSCSTSKYDTKSKSYRYSTVSKQLANDVYEIVWKLGYVPNICVSNSIKSDGRKVEEYIVLWSNTNYGNEPTIYSGDNESDNGGAIIKKVQYDDAVWCFEVPTNLFITRRNNKISIQGNSKFAQADGFVNPLTLIKVGGGTDGFKPTPEDLEQYRQIFECYDDETEVLTNEGFKLFKDVIDFEEKDGKIESKPKKDIKIGCFNPENEQLEYLTPNSSYCNNYNGDMYYYNNDKVNIKVTPDHDMWVSKKKYKYNPKKVEWSDFKKIKAKDLSLNDYVKFRSILNWNGKNVKFINVNGIDVDANLYLEFLGYLLSEGCCYTDNKSTYNISISQSTNKYFKKMNNCINKFAESINKKASNNINNKSIWKGTISGKDLYEHFFNQISNNGNSYSFNKKIPKHIKDLNKDLLNILLDALVDGDGSKYNNNNGTWRKTYWTTSKQLADDVQEIAFKCGYSPLLQVKIDERKNRKLIYYIQWSNDIRGDFPLMYKNTRNSITKEKRDTFNIEKYNGKIWCFTVPTGLFVTRRKGKITIQGNSAQYDKDFKIITHDGVSVDIVGRGQGIYDISGDITQLIKEIYIGLMVPQVIMDSGDITYANGGVAIDTLKQRYLQFRQLLSDWLRRHIFAPICKINDFYEKKDGKNILIVPEVEWNHMSLFDMGDYIQNLSQLLSQEPRKVSLHTIYRSLGLEYEDEKKKIKQENIDMIIQAKEMEALQRMSLNDLRSIGEDDEIQEITEGTLPGEQPYEPAQQMGGDMGGDMGSGLGGPLGGLGGGLGAPPGGGLGGPPGGPSGGPMGGESSI